MNLSKISFKWLSVAVGCVLMALFLIVHLFINITLPSKSLYPEKYFTTKQTGLEIPTRLKIPSINVDANVDQVGLTSLGAMDTPISPDRVAWFDLGPRPGEYGNSVIDGHSGFKDGKRAIFDNLYKLQRGDKIYVENKKGAMITFIVREIKKYNPNADATEVFVANDGKTHLNLITCAGSWNEIAKSHSDRLVVFADKEITI